MKGVIVAAGYGTRFLPVTRAVPKEMLPLVDRPAIDFLVDELVSAGVDELLVISSRRKKVMEDWFDVDKELEAVFTREGSAAKLAQLSPTAAKVHFLRQPEMRGTGHALLLARSFVGREPFVVAFPDDLFGQPNVTAALIAAHRQTGASVLSAQQLGPEADVSRYGVLDVVGDTEVRAVRRLVEKPPRGEEPSRWISLGRYLYTAEIFDALDARLAHHTRGEFFPVDAINDLAGAGRVVAAAVDAPRWDTGEPLGYVQAFIEAALERPELAPALRSWLATKL